MFLQQYLGKGNRKNRYEARRELFTENCSKQLQMIVNGSKHNIPPHLGDFNLILPNKLKSKPW